MIELLEFAVTPTNILYTILLIIILFYWVSVILGAVDMGGLDIDLDIDADLDVDADLDADVEASGGTFASALHFLNFGRLPFMVIMSFLILSMWVMGILSNYHYGNGSWGFAAAMFLPILCVGLIITKVITTPLIPIFKNFDTAAEPVDYIGKTCTLTLPATLHKMGQAEVNHEGNYLLINVKVAEEDVPAILRGEQAVIVDEEESGKYFMIKKADF